jgi:hypothetical protein
MCKRCEDNSGCTLEYKIQVCYATLQDTPFIQALKCVVNWTMYNAQLSSKEVPTCTYFLFLLMKIFATFVSETEFSDKKNI